MKKTIILLNGRKNQRNGFAGSMHNIGLKCLMRRTFLLVIYAILMGIFIYLVYGLKLYSIQNVGSRMTSPMMFSESVIKEEKMSCHLPKLDPFDKSIQKLYSRPYPDLNCKKEYPELFSTDLNSNLMMLDDPEEFGFKDCCYRTFTRENEDNIRLSEVCNPIEEAETKIHFQTEFIAVECIEIAKNKNKIVDMFGFIPLKRNVENRIERILAQMEMNGSQPKDQLNVVIFGLDGVSHMNFIRTMPKTFKFLTKNLSAFVLNGYNKVGDNTFPNLVPVLAGLTETELVSECWANPQDYFDDCPFIWKNFSKSGYRTGYAEDATWMGVFSYQKRGFMSPPTDYYLRTLTHAQANRIGHNKPGNSKLCYGPRMSFLTLLKNMRNMAAAMGPYKRYFQLTWATSLFHDYLTAPALGDLHLYSTLSWLKDKGHLNNTALILMSDHGIRWGEIRSTFQGKVEERMPLLYFVFPDWFEAKYSKALGNLRANRDKLTTPFDLHETLKDLMVLENLKDEKIISRVSDLQNALGDHQMPRGISLFLPISGIRTCPLAAIDDHWCVCHPMMPILTSDSTVQESAMVVVSDLNNLLSNSTKCSQLTLSDIKSAQTLKVNKNSSDTTKVNNDDDQNVLDISAKNTVISLILRTSPGDAVFEATVMKEGQGKGPWVVSGDISRINLYGEQSHCVSDYKLKKYCYCA